MYDVSDTLPVAELRPGTNVLVTGPAMSGKYDLLCGLLADGRRAGDAALVVTTQNDAGTVRGQIGMADADTPPLGIVDCVSKERGVEPAEHDLNRFVSSPGEFTGIGMSSSRLLEDFARQDQQTRVALDSVSQLLMYADVKTVFRFLHILTGRISAAGAIGFATLDANAHDEQTVNTVRQLFDGMVETRTGAEGRELRIVGFGSEPTEWTGF
ncbi:recombinase RecA [Haloarchaeobius sp. HME9146]|uniref:RAD55 family ATPase n=1 Tax=Haloarchaeobius sp. HME9146 TaxID=2978732 RepID=UPI0021C08ED5|nr:recombinase RecA [Haloarchaeobius sp. HME9146]MCT9097236.1 recombinase RecA [Haloarchaeobius sp. HME9146]